MNKLSYQTLQEAGYDGYLLKEAPERVIQFLSLIHISEPTRP